MGVLALIYSLQSDENNNYCPGPLSGKNAVTQTSTSLQSLHQEEAILACGEESLIQSTTPPRQESPQELIYYFLGLPFNYRSMHLIIV